MSNNNESSFGKISQFFSSSIVSSDSKSTNDDEITNKKSDNFINYPNASSSLSYSHSIKRPYSSIKKLNLSSQLSNCDPKLINHEVANKRKKLNEDIVSTTANTFDSVRRTNETSLPRQSSRLSLSTSSSTNTLYNNSKFLFTPLRHSVQLDNTRIPKDLNSSFSDIFKQSRSYFYPGRTSFGGANLRKSIHRLSATPYSISNIRCIEAKNANINKQNNSIFNENSRLSSVTQKILERLEKAATPIQDAKKRPSTFNSNIINKSTSSKLFDTVTPNVLNNGRCNVDFSYKPLKYVLKPVGDSSSTNEEQSNIKSSIFNEDIEKLKQIKNAEQELEKKKQISESLGFQPRKDVLCGKITSRDIKKGRKLGDDVLYEDHDDQEHLKSLAKIKPLSAPSIILKPFTLKSATETKNDNLPDSKNSFQFSSPTTISSSKSNTSSIFNVNFSSPINPNLNSGETNINCSINEYSGLKVHKDNSSEVDGGCISKQNKDSTGIVSNSSESLFNQFKLKRQSNLWTCPTCCVDNEADVAKCVSCEEPNPNKKASQTSKINQTSEFKFGSFSKPVEEKTSLNDLFKKVGDKKWTCGTCMVSNDFDEAKCVSCEEPNPNKESTVSVPKEKSDFKFGSFNKSEKQPSLHEFLKKDISKNWTCPTCMVSNDFDEAKCVSCEEPNPNKKSTLSVQQTQFKFGSFNKSPEDQQISLKTNDASQSQNVENKPETNSNESVIESWTCFYCKAVNSKSNSQQCNECNKIKVIAANKEQVQKFYETQTFKFGFNNPTLASTKSSVNTSIPSTSDFKFVAPTLTTTESNTKEKKVDQQSKSSSSTLFKSEQKPEKSIDSGFVFGVQNKNVAKIDNNLNNSNKTTDIKSTESELKSTSDSNNDKKSSSNLFQFGSVKPTSLFNFGANSQTTEASKISSSTTTSSTVSSSSLFSFGAKIPPTNSNSNVVGSSSGDIGTSTEPSSKTTSPIAETVSSNEKNKSSNAPTPVSSANSGLFSFESKNGSEKSSGSTNILFNFDAQKTSEKSDSNALNSSIFKFGSSASSSTPQSTSVTTTADSISSKFSFGNNASVATTTASESSLFKFGSSLPTPVTKSLTSTIGKDFNFGSPVNFPKIDIGSNVQTNSNININFPQKPTEKTSNEGNSSIFRFGTPAGNSSNFFGNTLSQANNTEVKFNIPLQTNVNSNNNSNATGSSCFQSVSIPTFNFNSNTTANKTNPSSIFSFGSKPNETQPQQTGFPIQTPSVVSAPTQSGFGGTPFGSNLNPALPSQPIMPSFGSSAFPNMHAPSNPGFSFSSEPHLNFQSFSSNSTSTEINIPAPDPSGVFKFSSDPAQIGTAQTTTVPLNRQIKKAKRRLK